MTIDSLNTEIKNALDSADRVLAAAESDTELVLLQSYKAALTGVREKVASLYTDKQFPDLTTARKFKRLESLQAKITAEIAALNKKAASVIKAGVNAALVDGFDKTAEAINAGLGVDLAFTELDTAAIKYAAADNLWLDLLKNHNGKLVTDVKHAIEINLRSNARHDVATGLATGSSYADVTRAITDKFNIAAGRAKTIARTEMHKSQSRGRLEGVNQAHSAAASLGLETASVWRHNLIYGDPRPDHVAADGQRAKDGMFSVGGESLAAPGLGSDPGNNINCHCSVQFEVLSIDPEGKYAKAG